MAFLCVDIGGTNTLIGVGNGDFEVVEKFSFMILKPVTENILDKSKVQKIDESSCSSCRTDG